MNELSAEGIPDTRRSPGHNAGTLLLGQIFARLVARGFYVVLARLLGPARIRDFAVGVAFGTLAAVRVEPGLNPQLIREGARDPARRTEYAAQAPLYKLIAAPSMRLTALVVARGRYRLQAVASGCWLCVNVALNLALLAWLGMRGAAIATASTSLISALAPFTEALRAGAPVGS